jgi:hypothetical protein
MANTLLTPDMLTREALRIFHQKSNYIGNTTRHYDDSFAKTGAKIGDQLRIRLPNEYTVTTGATMSVQDVTESSVTLPVQTQKHVAFSFTSAELTMSLDDFSQRILAPAVSVLAANVEADALNMYKDVANIVDADGTALSFLSIMNGRKFLQDRLAPDDGERVALLQPEHNVKLLDNIKGLFNSQEQISKQYLTGSMGKLGGFSFYENTLLTNHLTGTAAKTTGYLSNGASQTGASIVVDTGATTFNKGDVITFAGVNAVHPESKASLGYLKTFVITANYAGGAGTLSISPSIVASGARQNVSAAVADNSAVTKVGAGASEYLNTSMVFHPCAFAFATADLVLPDGVDFAARKTLDGISMRIIRQYDIDNDKFPCRLDILYGYKAIRPEAAVRIHADA